MNRKELNEIRKRLKPEKNNIGHIYGCYVNSKGEIISRIDESSGLMTGEENALYLALLKKTLSGSLGKNLMDISFATKQVMDSEEYSLLSNLRQTTLAKEELREDFYKKVIGSLDLGDDNYLLLLAHDAYDVPYYGSDGALQETQDKIFNYILCCVCPVKSGKGGLGYSHDEHRFSFIGENQLVTRPELGFMYPAFDDRSANIYSALFYTRNSTDIHNEFIQAVFNTPTPVSAGRQKDDFEYALADALKDDCSFDVVRSIHEQLSDCILAHKESKDPEALIVSPEDMAGILEKSGAASERIEAFMKDCAWVNAEELCFRPENIIDSKHFKIETPQVKISVNPDFADIIRTETIEGKKYILIPADEGVEINGIAVKIND